MIYKKYKRPVENNMLLDVYQKDIERIISDLHNSIKFMRLMRSRVRYRGFLVEEGSKRVLGVLCEMA